MHTSIEIPEVEDLNRLLVNRFREGIAPDYDTFVKIILDAAVESMNNTEIGQELMEQIRAEAIRDQITQEEWNLKKAKLLRFMFFFAVDQIPRLKQEMARLLYKELRKADA